MSNTSHQTSSSPTVRTREGREVPLQWVKQANADLRRIEQSGEKEEIMERGREVLAAHRLGQSLHALRQRRGLTLDQVADRCGISKANLSRLENGKQDNPTLRTLTQVLDALNGELQLVAREPQKQEAEA